MKNISIIILFNLIGLSAFGQNKSEKDYYKTLTDSFPFDHYKIVEKSNSGIAKLDITSLPDLPNDIVATIKYQYKTIQTPNFAGHYIIISWGCGSPCQMNAIAESGTGKICETFSSSNGVDFRADSKLIICNPPDSTVYHKEYRDLIGPPVFYIWDEDKLIKLR